MKFEVPRLINISERVKAKGGIEIDGCRVGSSNVSQCTTGDSIAETGGCRTGGIPTVECGSGGQPDVYL